MTFGMHLSHKQNGPPSMELLQACRHTSVISIIEAEMPLDLFCHILWPRDWSSLSGIQLGDLIYSCYLVLLLNNLDREEDMFFHVHCSMTNYYLLRFLPLLIHYLSGINEVMILFPQIIKT